MSENDAQKRIEKDPLLKEAMAEILRIQPRFNPDPTFAQTGVGELKSEGVEELKKIKEQNKNKKSGSSS